MSWFVILNAPEWPTPLMEDDVRMAIFATEEEACAEARSNEIGDTLGFQTFELETEP
jgi:hypothetical protein